MAWWKEERGERIFVDFNQANRDRTMAGAYSPRALPHATGVDAAGRGTSWSSVDPTAFTIAHRAGAAGEDRRPVGAVSMSIRARSTRCSSWWERDLAAGLGELPFPPDYPKMPGEPPRVQPSRARKAD